jgi:hypothetical protein
MEDELGVLLFFPRQMAVQRGARRLPLQPPWRKGSGLSSPSLGRWRRGGGLGALLFQVFSGGFKRRKGVCIVADGAVAVRRYDPCLCCKCASATSARTWAPCRAPRTVPPAISHSWRAPWGDIPHGHPHRLGHRQHLSASLHDLRHPPISWRQQWPAKEVRLHLLFQQRFSKLPFSCVFPGPCTNKKEKNRDI